MDKIINQGLLGRARTAKVKTQKGAEKGRRGDGGEENTSGSIAVKGKKHFKSM